MKASLESVQGTLITSVRLIQDQLDQFSTQMTSAIDSRMGKMEAKLERFETSMKKLDERSEGWSAMQHHILSWGDQMISLDSKVSKLFKNLPVIKIKLFQILWHSQNMYELQT